MKKYRINKKKFFSNIILIIITIFISMLVVEYTANIEIYSMTEKKALLNGVKENNELAITRYNQLIKKGYNLNF